MNISSEWTRQVELGKQPTQADLLDHLKLVHQRHAGFTEKIANNCKDRFGKNSYDLLFSSGTLQYLEYPYVILDRINSKEMTIGGNVKGGICNVVYFPNSISKERIDLNYRMLKNKNPPIV